MLSIQCQRHLITSRVSSPSRNKSVKFHPREIILATPVLSFVIVKTFSNSPCLQSDFSPVPLLALLAPLPLFPPPSTLFFSFFFLWSGLVFSAALY